MIALMMFLFLSGGAKKAAPKVAHHAVCPEPNCANPSPVMSSGEIVSPAKLLLGPYTYPFEFDPRHSAKVNCQVYRCDDAIVFSSGIDAEGKVVNGTTVMLSYNEYARLQYLRKAVADEEKRLAVKYGAQESGCDAMFDGICLTVQPDHYSYHGQFLLIEKAKEDKQ